MDCCICKYHYLNNCGGGMTNSVVVIRTLK